MLKSIAVADDTRDPNGHTILNYFDAQVKVRAWAEGVENKFRDGRRCTVRHAVEDYLGWFKLNRKSYDVDLH